MSESAFGYGDDCNLKLLSPCFSAAPSALQMLTQIQKIRLLLRDRHGQHA